MKQLRGEVGSHREPGQMARLAAVLVTSAIALAGCGASGSTTKVAAVSQEVKTAAKVSTTPTVAVPSSVEKQEKALHDRVLSALHGPPPPGTEVAGIPKYLRGKTRWVQATATATLARPRLTIAGEGLVADIPGGRATLMVNGPIGEGKFAGTRAPAIPGSFRMTISGVRGSLPLSAADFVLVDVRGERLIPYVTVRGGGKLPSEVSTGQTLTVEITSMLPVGDGALIFSPADGAQGTHHTLAGWDFVVEDD